MLTWKEKKAEASLWPLSCALHDQPADGMVWSRTLWGTPPGLLSLSPGPGCAVLVPVDYHGCRTHLSNDPQNSELQG